ncbi:MULTISPECIES: ImmA/IrrE family metallo-endopeptidase [Bifidobacterium]|uniref:ImmA/IrrE family metallo-endopeptidase n=1 Tax=Bifidobacterium tibiigranuli TaxID=2172043 RepID=A0A5N6SAI4_9BIFI|nr:ImmA/IrrE family metallo-endopeptidase [Bifidobacterium tibiigranuli]KAE8130248.1 ImmA/IrrE family metallo-endopeptidase [Bifidobacterium tibiigranuli]KAE8130393.1 ImmA/IrrE family metallo-endopeptidase [Bifidobacterium tibiigranuli]
MPERDLRIDRRMTYGDLRRYADTLDVTVCSDRLPAGVNGVYDEQTKTIVIDRSLRYTQKRCTLVHELVHWSYFDSSCVGLASTKAETRTRRLTARTLVPGKYLDMLGSEYDGEPALIANELNVTVGVLEDYWRLVYSRSD